MATPSHLLSINANRVSEEMTLIEIAFKDQTINPCLCWLLARPVAFVKKAIVTGGETRKNLFIRVYKKGQRFTYIRTCQDCKQEFESPRQFECICNPCKEVKK